jgi:hypothetical protein
VHFVGGRLVGVKTGIAIAALTALATLVAVTAIAVTRTALTRLAAIGAALLVGAALALVALGLLAWVAHVAAVGAGGHRHCGTGRH